MKSTFSVSQEAKDMLLFIPDISGFTQFVNETEISHSQHIIEELLEVMIDANDLDMEISEIEGDAILFYREGKAPTAAEILAQIRKMFIAFHSHLRKYETQRLCHCGACKSAQELSLKFIAHYGAITKNQIKSFSKLFGKDVIVAHRLMKNNVPHHEYALFTHSLTDACDTWDRVDDISWKAPVQDSGSYDFGDIEYCYIPLDDLLAQVPEPQVADYSPRGFDRQMATTEHMIEAPMELVFSVLADLNFRGKWQVGVMEKPELDSKINKLGAGHRCIVDGPMLYTTGFERSKNTIVYTEADGKDGVSVFTLRRIGKGMTAIQFDFFMRKHILINTIFNLKFKKKMIRVMRESFNNLNTYCRDLYAQHTYHPNGVVLEMDMQEA